MHCTLLAWGSGRELVRVEDWLLADRRTLVVACSTEVALWKDPLGRSEGFGVSSDIQVPIAAAADSLTVSLLGKGEEKRVK